MSQYFDLTEQGNANQLADLCKKKGSILRYDHRQQQWIGWSEGENRWFTDETTYIYNLANEVALIRETQAKKELTRLLNEEAAQQIVNDCAIERGDDEAVKVQKRRIGWAKKSKNFRNKVDSLKLAAAHKDIAFKGEWDANQNLFQVENGVLDLTPGRIDIRPAAKADNLLKRSTVSYDFNAKCPRWTQFLEEVFENDGDTIKYVQRCVGYTLTGSVKEQCLFACTGGGANGKSTFFGVLSHLMGEYTCELKASALEKGDRVIGEGTGLNGARLATCVEIGEEKPLFVSRIKTWTGGDTMVVRPLYKGEIHFKPTHKLWLSFNNYPKIEEGTDAIWRRIKIIPFNVKFEGNKVDKNLLEILLTESSGILNWAAEGCALYHAEGLEQPKKLSDLTASYREDSDTFSAFMEQNLQFTPGAFLEARELKAKYEGFCEQLGCKPMDTKGYASRLRHRGATSKVKRFGRATAKIWQGVTLVTATSDIGNTPEFAQPADDKERTVH